MTDAPSLELFTGLRDRDYAREGLLVCEGRIVLEKAVRAGLKIRAVLAVPADADYCVSLCPAGTPLSVLARPEMEGHIGFSFHRGVLALAERPPRTGPDSLPDAAPPGPALVLWNVTDPDNLGTLIRSAAALGARAIYLGGGSADPYGRKALRSSMGNALCLPLFFLESPEDLPLARGPGGTVLVAAARSPEALRPGELKLSGFPTIVLGNVGWGLPAAVLERCDSAVMLPMAAGVDSLNVGAAGAILLWELSGKRMA